MHSPKTPPNGCVVDVFEGSTRRAMGLPINPSDHRDLLPSLLAARPCSYPDPRATNCVDFETRVAPLVREPSSWLHQGHPYCLTRLRRAINTGAAATHLLSLAGAVGKSIAHPAKTQNGVRAHNLRADRPPSVIAFESVLLDPEAPVQ
jgi:hypothetical protein